MTVAQTLCHQDIAGAGVVTSLRQSVLFHQAAVVDPHAPQLCHVVGSRFDGIFGHVRRDPRPSKLMRNIVPGCRHNLRKTARACRRNSSGIEV